MSNDDFSIKVALDFDKKDLKGLENDVQKAVSSGAKKAESISNTISKKASEIQAAASSSIYKYGSNHLKTKAILGDLSRAQKAKSTSKIYTEKEKIESIRSEYQKGRHDSFSRINKTREEYQKGRHESLSRINKTREEREALKKEYQKNRQESLLRMSRMRESDLGERIASRNKKTSHQKMSDLFKNVRSISFSSMKSAYGITSLVSKLGPAGAVAGTVLAAGLGVGKAIKWAGDKTLNYSSLSMGAGGYTSGDMAALTSGAVPGINKGIGKSLADSFSINAPYLSRGYLPRRANVLSRATQAVSLYKGGMHGIRNLFSLKDSDSEKQVYTKIFSDIHNFMKEGKVNAAVRLGSSFQIPKKAVLEAKYNKNINSLISKTGSSGSWKGFDNLTNAALKQTSAIDHLTGQFNKLAAVVTNITNSMSKAASKSPSKGPMDSMLSEMLNFNPLNISPGNSPKGNR